MMFKSYDQCVPSSIPGLHVICGPSLLVLYPVSMGFSPGTPVFPFPQESVFNLILF